MAGAISGEWLCNHGLRSSMYSGALTSSRYYESLKGHNSHSPFIDKVTLQPFHVSVSFGGCGSRAGSWILHGVSMSHALPALGPLAPFRFDELVHLLRSFR